MKKSIFIVLFSLPFVVLSCTKNENKMPEELVGSWEWIRTEMPVSPEYPPKTPENTGNQHVLSFTSDKTWTYLRNDTVCGKGTLEFDLWQDEDQSENYNCMLFYNTVDGVMSKMFYSITSANELHLYYHPLSGGSAHNYFKKMN